MAKRQRVTVTLRSDLLRSLDRTIDHQKVRSRSQAIELLLARTLGTEAHQAVILASGQGVKMRPFTYEIPKPLIPVNGRPLLEYGINLLRQHGLTDIIITVSHLAEKIERHFGDGEKFGVRIRYIHERRPSGTGGALMAASKYIENDPFLLLYGDVLADLDVNEFMQVHQDTKASVGTLALTSVEDPSAYGAVKLRGSRVVEFSEKPIISSEVSRLVFAGLATFDPSVFAFFPRKKSGLISLENDIFPQLIADGRLYGYPFEGQWFDVSTPETYEQVLKHWRR